MDIYGIISNGVHYDVSKSIKGAKNFATRNGYDVITIRINSGYICYEIAYKNKKGNWISLTNGQKRYY